MGLSSVSGRGWESCRTHCAAGSSRLRSIPVAGLGRQRRTPRRSRGCALSSEKSSAPTRSCWQLRVFCAGTRPATAVVVRFITEHHVRFGVEPICRVLTMHGCKIAPSTYYAARDRPPSARARRDELVLVQVRRVHKAARGGLYGSLKVYHQLRREKVLVEGRPVARCTIERVMHDAGLRGVRRDRRVRTTIPDAAAARPPDLVDRTFTADAPNQLWVVDFTYVATMAGFVYVAFVIGVFSRMIVGWRAARSMKI